MDDDRFKSMMEAYKEQVQLNTKLLERQEKFIDSLNGSTKQLIEAIHTQTASIQATLSVGMSGLSEKMTRDHGAINLRIYMALGGMISILVTLISLWIVK